MGHGTGAVLVNLLAISPIITGLSSVHHEHCVHALRSVADTCQKTVGYVAH